MHIPERPRTHPEINKFRRDTLIQATLQVVAEHGIENATVARICETAGASRGLANHYFSGKDELLLFAFEKLLEDLKEATAKAAKLQAMPAGKLLAIVRTIFSEELFSNTARAAYLCFWTASLSSPEFRKVRKINRSSYANYHGSMARLFERAAKERGIKLDASLAAFGLIGMMDGFWLELSIGVENFSSAGAVKACDDYVARVLNLTSVELADLTENEALPRVSRPARRAAR